MASSALENIAVVLWEPQDDINIGTTVRACKNFGVTDIRLVCPRQADPHIIGVSAPNAADVIATIAHFDDLEHALHDCVLTLGTTARPRHQERLATEPRGAAQTAVEVARQQTGKVAYLFGREDSGLPNSALDRCHIVVNIPTRPDYSSLNLGQAVLLNMWEVFRVANDTQIARPDVLIAHPDREFPPADMASMEHMFALIERVIARTDFFKTPTNDHIMSLVRNVFMRAALDRREQSTWFGIFHELERTLKRLADR